MKKMTTFVDILVKALHWSAKMIDL